MQPKSKTCIKKSWKKISEVSEFSIWPNAWGQEFDVDMEKDVEKEYKQFFKNRLVNVSQKLKQETLEEMKKCLLEKDASITISADITNIKLISLMEDKGIITMENCACLASIFHRTGQSDLIEKLPRKCKYFLSCYSIKT